MHVFANPVTYMCILLASARCYSECWESEQALSVVLPVRVISLNKESLPNGPPHLQGILYQCKQMGNPYLRGHTASFCHLPGSSDLLLLYYKGLPCSNTQCPCSLRRTQALYGGIHSLSTTSDERDPKRTSYREISKGMQAYYHYHHVVNTVDIYKGSIAS